MAKLIRGIFDPATNRVLCKTCGAGVPGESFYQDLEENVINETHTTLRGNERCDKCGKDLFKYRPLKPDLRGGDKVRTKSKSARYADRTGMVVDLGLKKNEWVASVRWPTPDATPDVLGRRNSHYTTTIKVANLVRIGR